LRRGGRSSPIAYSEGGNRLSGTTITLLKSAGEFSLIPRRVVQGIRQKSISDSSGLGNRPNSSKKGEGGPVFEHKGQRGGGGDEREPSKFLRSIRDQKWENQWAHLNQGKQKREC